VSGQTEQCQHLESARKQLRRIQDRCILCHPLPYEEIKGIKLYEQFLDRRRWPEFAARGYQDARRRLSELGRKAPASRPRKKRASPKRR
jgi:hypothetical protein